MKTGYQKLFWILVAVTVVIQVALMYWASLRLGAEAGGLRLFDLQPFGYSFDHAKTYLAALSTDGLAMYLGVVSKLDTVFPIVYAAIWVC